MNTDAEIKAYNNIENLETNRTRFSLNSPTQRKGRGKERQQEVSAWANYENVAKEARIIDGAKRTISNRRSNLRNEIVEDDKEQQTVRLSRHFGDATMHSFGFTDESGKEDFTINENHLNEERDLFAVYFPGAHDFDASVEDNGSKKAKIQLLSTFKLVDGTVPWLPDFIKRMLPVPAIFLFIEWCLRGIGQVYFLNNPFSGLLILSGLFIQSSRVAVHGVIGVVSGNITALFLGFDKSLMASGLFGYNSVLVGLALSTFYSSEVHSGYYLPITLGTIVAASFSTVLFTMMGKLLVPYKSPPLTLPFNVATLIFLMAVANMANIDMDSVRYPSLPNYKDFEVDKIDFKSILEGSLRGVGQVFLANNLVASSLILAGIFVCSRVIGVAAFVGSLFGCLLATLTGVSSDTIANGMYGFNCSLTVASLFMFYVPTYRNTYFGLVAAIVTVISQHALSTFLLPFGLPYMTLPFCIVALPFILIQGTTSLVKAVPLASMTVPEDHLRRVNMLKSGFQLLLEALDRGGNRPGRSSIMSFQNRAVMNLENHMSDFIKPVGNFKVNDKDAVRAMEIFDKIVEEGHECINDDQLSTYLSSTLHFNNTKGLFFVARAFHLVDLDGKGFLNRQEFVGFVKLSHRLAQIRASVSHFFEFVDTDGSMDINIGELNAALNFLEQPPLSPEDENTLEIVFCGENKENEEVAISIDDLVDFVLVSKLKMMTRNA